MRSWGRPVHSNRVNSTSSAVANRQNRVLRLPCQPSGHINSRNWCYACAERPSGDTTIADYISLKVPWRVLPQELLGKPLLAEDLWWPLPGIPFSCRGQGGGNEDARSLRVEVPTPFNFSFSLFSGPLLRQCLSQPPVHLPQRGQPPPRASLPPQPAPAGPAPHSSHVRRLGLAAPAGAGSGL